MPLGPTVGHEEHSNFQVERLATNDASFPKPVNAESSIEEYENAIKHQHDRLDCISPTDPDRLHILYEESIVWYLKYHQTRIIDDLDQSIRACRLATLAMAADYTGKRVVYNHLSKLLEARCTAQGSPNDQDEAFTYGKLALAELEYASDPGSRRWWTLHNETLSSLCRLLVRFPGATIIEWLVTEHNKALSIMAPSSNLRSRYLSRLCYLLSIRRAHGDLAEAINAGYNSIKALEYAERNDSEYLTLGNALFVHYQVENLYRSLQEAMQQTAISLEKDLPTYHLISLCNLGSMLEAKCQRLRETNRDEALVVIDEVIDIGDKALALVRDDDLRLSHILNMVAAWHTTKMTIVSDIEIGDAAGRLFDRALALRCPGQAEYPHILNGLAHLREVQFQILTAQGKKREAFEHLNKAVAYAEKSLETTNDDDPLLGERRLNLGKMLLRTCLITDDPWYDLEATKYFISAFETFSAPLQIRIQGAIQAGIDTHQAGDAVEANRIYQRALKLLSSLNEYSISSQDLQQTLRFVSGLATFAASIALEAGHSPYDALMCLETGRCVISGITISSKVDLSELRKVEPDLANEYDELRRQYARASRDLEQREKYHDARARQQQVAKQLATTESLIRKAPGWESFQLAMTEGDVRELAADGPIIVVNATQIRSDAFVITEERITCVQLPEMSYEKLMQYVPLFNLLGSGARRNIKQGKKNTAKTTATDALLWIWTVAVEPILAVTELTSSRRVWWLTTGLAGRAPFHAAGDHRPGSTNNTHSRVISSYISSLKALRFSRSRSSAVAQRRKMLLVTMSKNPSPHRDLDTSYEETTISENFTRFNMHLSHPKPVDVLELLPSFPFVHFACHGASIAYDPSQSGLLLAEDGEAAMLTIADLEKIDLKEGAIAYLSACSTAEQSDGKLADEAIHLANSFQALGFQHVIGTMWGAEDVAAGEVAGRFYAKLFPSDEAQHVESELDVARALHEAIKDYMGETQGGVVSWGPFIHIGS